MTQKTMNVHLASMTGFIGLDIAKKIISGEYDHVYHEGVRIER